MQEFWHRPIVLMMVLAGAYFAVRTNRVFSQNLHNDTDVSFLFNRCGKPLRPRLCRGHIDAGGGKHMLSVYDNAAHGDCCWRSGSNSMVRGVFTAA